MDRTLPEAKLRLPAIPPAVLPAIGVSLPRRAASTVPNATLVERRDDTAQVATFMVRPDDPTMTHRPGQYATLGLEVDGAAISRPYSMASLPGGASWEFHIRRVRDGAFTTRLFDLPIGARLRLGPAKGLFVLEAGDTRPHLFMATGTGIAPFVAMLRAELATGAPRPTTLVHGAAHADELGYAELLRDWERQGVPLRYVPTISRPADRRNDGWRGVTGRAEDVLARDWADLGLDPSQTVAYLCGNPGMVTTAEGTLLAGGFPVANVRREAYWLDRSEGSPAAPAA
jgi:ferredoxin-NADP reductase